MEYVTINIVHTLLQAIYDYLDEIKAIDKDGLLMKRDVELLNKITPILSEIMYGKHTRIK